MAGALGALERALVRVVSGRAVRRRPEEPVEEREFLRVIREAVVVNRVVRTGQRIADLEIILTARNLARVAPRGRAVVDERIVVQLAELVRIGADVLQAAKDAGIGVRARGIDLDAAVEALLAVIADDAAAAFGFHDVVGERNGDLRCRGRPVMMLSKALMSICPRL